MRLPSSGATRACGETCAPPSMFLSHLGHAWSSSAWSISRPGRLSKTRRRSSRPRRLRAPQPRSVHRRLGMTSLSWPLRVYVAVVVLTAVPALTVGTTTIAPMTFVDALTATVLFVLAWGAQRYPIHLGPKL